MTEFSAYKQYTRQVERLVDDVNARENTFEGKTFAIVEKVFSYNDGKCTLVLQ